MGDTVVHEILLSINIYLKGKEKQCISEQTMDRVASGSNRFCEER